jgi:hypothetical protein
LKGDKGKQREEEDFFAYYIQSGHLTMKNHVDETHRLEEEITSILREPSVRPERSPQHCETTDINTSPPSHVSNICTNSPHSEHSNHSSSTSSSSSVKTIKDADEDLLQNQPYLSTDHTPAIETSADMYYDRDWCYPDTEPEKHKYVFGKSPGECITARHAPGEYHKCYPIPLDRGDDVNQNRLARSVPRSRGKVSEEVAWKVRKEKEAVTQSSRKLEPFWDILPHLEQMDRDSRNTARSAYCSNLWKHQTAKEQENITNQESVSNAKLAWRKMMDESISAPPTYE